MKKENYGTRSFSSINSNKEQFAMANFLSRKGKPPHISHHGLSGLPEIRFLATKAFAPPTPREISWIERDRFTCPLGCTKSIGSWDLEHVHGLLISDWNAFSLRWQRIDSCQASPMKDTKFLEWKEGTAVTFGPPFLGGGHK